VWLRVYWVQVLLLCVQVGLLAMNYAMLSGRFDNVTGVYNPFEEGLAVKTGGREPLDVLGTCVHEVGHYVWDEYLDDSDRRAYSQIYNDSVGFVSFYALVSDAEEDFCESLEAYVRFTVDSYYVPDDRQGFLEGTMRDLFSDDRGGLYITLINKSGNDWATETTILSEPETEVKNVG
jgi:hypothetical protein